MPADLPYLYSVKNLAAILLKVKTAGTPPKFTYEFLKSNLGYPSSSDRPIISVFKKLGFLNPDGTPTARYNDFRDASKSDHAMATGLREGWAPVFLSDQRAYERSTSQLTEIFKSVTGKHEGVAAKMAATFKALASSASWDAAPAVMPPGPGEEEGPPPPPGPRTQTTVGLHHDIHIHLPATSDVAVYTAIFRALREELL